MAKKGQAWAIWKFLCMQIFLRQIKSKFKNNETQLHNSRNVKLSSWGLFIFTRVDFNSGVDKVTVIINCDFPLCD